MHPIPGKIVKLPVEVVDEEGAWLTAGDITVLLPARYMGSEVEEDGELEVCLFHGDDGELQASRRLPHTPLGSVGFLTVNDVHKGAAYVSIGLPRDLVIPEDEQAYPLADKDRAVVLVCYDNQTGKLFGSTRILTRLRTDDVPLSRGEEVEALIFDKADFGWRAVINGKYCGVILRNEIFHDVKRGKVFKAWVKEIDHGTAVCSLQREGQDGLEDAARRIMSFLHHHKGYMRLNENTDADEIKLRLRMSKKAFKNAAEHLMRQGKVVITKRGVKLVKGEEPSPEPEAES